MMRLPHDPAEADETAERADLPELYLALDTSAGASAALISSGQVVAEHHTQATRSHSEVLTTAVEDVMRAVGITAADAPQKLAGIIVGVGPGPFTGLRVGVVTAQSFGFTWGIPVHGVMSLDGLAFQVAAEAWRVGAEEFVAVTDARRTEVYWAHYRVIGGQAQRAHGPFVTAAQHVTELPAYGAGAGLYAHTLKAMTGFEDTQPTAAGVGLFGAQALRRGETLEPVEPQYLRGHDAKIPQAMRTRHPRR